MTGKAVLLRLGAVDTRKAYVFASRLDQHLVRDPEDPPAAREIARKDFYYMPELSPMTEIEQGIYGQLECSKKVFTIVQRLTEIARDVDQTHQDNLRELTEELLAVGKELSDNAAKIGKSLGDLIAKK